MWWGTSCFQVNLQYRLVNIDLNSKFVAVTMEGVNKLPFWLTRCANNSIEIFPYSNTSNLQWYQTDYRNTQNINNMSRERLNLANIIWKSRPFYVANMHLIVTMEDARFNQILNFSTRYKITLELFSTNHPRFDYRWQKYLELVL